MARFQEGFSYVILVVYGRTMMGVSVWTVTDRYRCFSGSIIQGYDSVLCLTCSYGRRLSVYWKDLTNELTNPFDIFDANLGYVIV